MAYKARHFVVRLVKALFPRVTQEVLRFYFYRLQSSQAWNLKEADYLSKTMNKRFGLAFDLNASTRNREKERACSRRVDTVLGPATLFDTDTTTSGFWEILLLIAGARIV